MYELVSVIFDRILQETLQNSVKAYTIKLLAADFDGYTTTEYRAIIWSLLSETARRLASRVKYLKSKIYNSVARLLDGSSVVLSV